MKQPHIDIAELVRRGQAMAQGVGLGGPPGDGALTEVTGVGSNPGQLRMLEFVPDRLPAGAPLVVALHGCTQTAGGYDRGSGWSTLAARLGFALLLPEQRPGNNANRCFNWFEPGDTRREHGEALSIRQMVAYAVAHHRLDPRRVFLTGLSAGGAMASVMLATYPEVFAAGAIIAGLPYGAAHSMPEAFEAMATARPRSGHVWGEAVRRASPHHGPWPRVSVWQGEADGTVRPDNAEEILKQWRDLHGLAGAPQPGKSLGPAHHHRVWRGRDGTPLLEHHAIAGMGHGVPIAPRGGPDALGEAMPYMLDVGIPSTALIAGFFGLGGAAARAGQATGPVISVGRDGGARVAPAAASPAEAAAAPAPQPAAAEAAPRQEAPRAATTAGATEAPPRPEPRRDAPPPPHPEAPPRAGRRFDPGHIIRKALRAAGLLDR
ncbi:extracellular catalytic domain type 1 short-chain-length polyhydroxyalkanoate depolymerase [Paracraurococcus lichenis]|uniref:PHB depolymerase family esterase n=1 Tax=Paracraurococcus lichenis TaxID=3064888 RepID=A0ABT9DSZ5_9PROT|nr:PHB depolymerase family esterase [Paracraurococcus sp. LOR1-02]MDO9707017.1 PHB depolymerase family esterase [Paracraurococcus sp. LOR1-02]